MKKLSFLMFALAATMMMFAQEATAYKVTWVTNGVELPTKPTSNEELWKAFMPAYNAYYGLSRGEQPITAVATFANAKMQEFMTDEKSDWKWLGDYILGVVEASGFNGGALTSEVLWRFNVQAFFNCKEAASSTWNGNPDFTEAGKYENWIGVWVKANSLPETMTSEDAMPTLEREGYTLVGWYDNAELTGEPVTSVTADVTLYAKWEVVAYKVTWVTNGVELPTKPTSNEELWKAFMPAYNAYYGLSRGEQPITAVATFANAKMQEFMTDEKSDWKWLGDYILGVVEASGFNGGALTSEVLWRFNVQAFFNCKEAASSTWNGNPDFTEAGKYENWIGAWKAANLLPETMTIEDPMPVLEKPEYTFLGWYDNEACTGDIVTKVTKECTLYAGWERAVYNVEFVAPFAYPNPMYAADKDGLYANLNEDYNTFYKVNTDWGTLSTFTGIADGMPSKGGKLDLTFFADSVMGAKWGWLLDYCDTIVLRAQAAGADPEKMKLPSTNASYARYNINAFFMNSVRPSRPISADYATCGIDAENQEWKKFWGYEFTLADTIAEDYTLPAMYRKNYEFKGWYWNADFSGEAVTVVPVKSNGTLYAKFEPTEFALLGIELSKKDTVELQMPATDTLSVIFKPETAVNKNVTWSSSDENVLVVENGVVTPKGPGVAIVKVVSEESELVATVVYNIKARVGAVTGVTLDKTTLTLPLGETATLVATVAPEDAIDKSLTWESDGKAVSVVDGVIKADTVGSATITVTTVDGGYTATCKVTVPEPINADVKVEKLWDLAIDTKTADISDVRNGMGFDGKFYLTDKKAQTIRVFTQNGEDTEATIALNAADMVGKHNEWQFTYDTVIVDLDTTITKKDSAMVEVATTYELGTGIAIDDAGNIVFGTGFPDPVKAIGIIKKGEKKPTIIEVTLPTTGRADQITAFGDIFSAEGGLVAIYPQYATQVQLVKIANGQLVEAKALAGNVIAGTSPAQVIYATETEAWSHARGNKPQYVKDGVATTLDLKNINTSDLGGARIMIGSNEVMAYKVGTTHSSEFAVRNMTAQQFAADKDGNTVYYVVDTKAASNNSYANFTKAEKINDYAYYLYVFTSGKGAGVFKVYQEVAVESIALDQATATVKAGEKLQLTATITPEYATVKDVVWSTSDSTVAIVDQNGLVQTVKAGEATITATTVDGGLVATCALTVKAVFYHRAMNVAELKAGKKMLIVNAGDTLAMAQARANNFGQVAIAPVDGVLSDVPAEATIITIEKDSVFAFAVDGGYLTATTAKSNYLRVAEERGTLTEWDITIDAAGLATIICHDVESERNTIRYNKGSEIFSAYKPGTQEDVVIYVEVEETYLNALEMEVVMTNLVATDMGTFEMLEASDDMFTFQLGVYADGSLHEGSMIFATLPTGADAELTVVDGYITMAYSEELATNVYTGIIYAQMGEELYKLIVTMYAGAVEPIEVVVEGAEVSIDEELEVLTLASTWTYEDVTYPIAVRVNGYVKAEGMNEYEAPQVGELEIGDDNLWFAYATTNLVAVVVDGDAFTVEGDFMSPMGDVFAVMISGKLVGSGLDNIQLDAETIKVIKNGQMFIIKNSVEYNAQGAVIK